MLNPLSISQIKLKNELTQTTITALVTFLTNGTRYDIPHLKQDFWAHAKEAVNNSEGKHHRHAVDVPRNLL